MLNKTNLLNTSILVLIILLISTTAFSNNQKQVGEIPNGLSEAEWYGVQKQIYKNNELSNKNLNNSFGILQDAYIKSSDTTSDGSFGISVAISGNTLVVGGSGAEAAYVFIYSNGQWNQQAILESSNTTANDDFGFAVDISGDTIIVGAPNEQSNDQPGFDITSDVDVTNLVNIDNTQFFIEDFVSNIVMGPDDESEQNVHQFNLEVSDLNSILNDISLDNEGNLYLDFSLNFGITLVEVTMQDDGGI